MSGGAPLQRPSADLRTVRGAGTRHVRLTTQIKLRLSAIDAERLRARATLSRRTMSEFVVDLLDGGVAGEDALTEASRLASAIYALAENVRLMRADMGRVAGLVKHLFVEAAAAAEPHHFQLAEVVRDLRGPGGAISRADCAIEEVREVLPALRGSLAATVRKLAARDH